MLNQLVKIGDGGNGLYAYHGIFAFTTTGTTKAINVPLSRVTAAIAAPVEASAAAEAQLSCVGTVSGTAGTDAVIVGSTQGTTITVTRPAGTTSGLKFSLIVFGR